MLTQFFSSSLCLVQKTSTAQHHAVSASNSLPLSSMPNHSSNAPCAPAPSVTSSALLPATSVFPVSGVPPLAAEMGTSAGQPLPGQQPSVNGQTTVPMQSAPIAIVPGTGAAHERPGHVTNHVSSSYTSLPSSLPHSAPHGLVGSGSLPNAPDFMPQHIFSATQSQPPSRPVYSTQQSAPVLTPNPMAGGQHVRHSSVATSSVVNHSEISLGASPDLKIIAAHPNPQAVNGAIPQHPSSHGSVTAGPVPSSNNVMMQSLPGSALPPQRTRSQTVPNIVPLTEQPAAKPDTKQQRPASTSGGGPHVVRMRTQSQSRTSTQRPPSVPGHPPSDDVLRLMQPDEFSCDDPKNSSLFPLLPPISQSPALQQDSQPQSSRVPLTMEQFKIGLLQLAQVGLLCLSI